MQDNHKFKMMNDSEIEMIPGNDTTFICMSTNPAVEIILKMNSVDREKIACLWIGSKLADSIIGNVYLDTSCVISELSKQNFIGHFSKVITFISEDIDPNGYRIFLKRAYEQ